MAFVMSLPGQTNGVSPFTDPLIEALRISRNALSLAYLVGTISSAALLTFAGRAYDRLGSQTTGAIAATGLGLSLFGLSSLPAISRGLTTAGVDPAIATITSLTAGFFLIRFFGQGLITLVGKTMLFKWYDDKRGQANAVLSIAVPLVFSGAPLVFDGLIRGAGWQGAWMILGLILFPGFAVVSFLVFRDPPKQGTTPTALPGVGRRPGFIPAWLVRLIARTGIRPTREPRRPPVDADLSEVVRSLPFWAFNGVVTLSSMLITGFTFHVVGIFAEAGIGRATALAVFLPSSFVSIAVQSLGSLLSDYVRLKYFAILHAVSLIALLALLPFLGSGPLPYMLVVVAHGVSLALFGINSSVVWPRFYGLTHLGSINGFAGASMAAGSALGPYAFSLSYDLLGRFSALGIVFIPVCAVLVVTGFAANNPNRRFITESS
ncbi:MAG: MFS transporter [Spirochaetaceae bacterium]|nr:MAG: MFS transporter [Spirochaetaceae bacterium]